MNEKQLFKDMKELIDKYVENKEIATELVGKIEPLKIKYILGELDRNKTKDYCAGDKEVIKDIYFYYC
jgi:hypothetical protein